MDEIFGEKNEEIVLRQNSRKRRLRGLRLPRRHLSRAFEAVDRHVRHLAVALVLARSFAQLLRRARHVKYIIDYLKRGAEMRGVIRVSGERGFVRSAERPSAAPVSTAA